MFGFLLGAACLGGLVALAAQRRRASAFGHGCGHGRRFGSPWSPGGWRGRYLLHAVLERLDTTPGQEKVIVAAVDEFRDTAQQLRVDVLASRERVASALRGEVFDANAVDSVFVEHQESLARLGRALSGAFSTVHEVLDPEQRKRLARLVETGPRWGFN